jgi:hypothetical protein
LLGVTAMEREFLGKVMRLASDRLVYLVQEGAKGECLAFGLNAIRGYGGEYPRELKQFSRKGLRAGCLVLFTLDRSGERITSVRPVVFKK